MSSTRIGAATAAGSRGAQRGGPKLARRLDPQPQRLQRVITSLSLVGTGMNIPLFQGATSGTVVAAVLIPVWWPTLRRFRSAKAVIALGVAAMAAGLLLTAVASSTHQWGHSRLIVMSIYMLTLVGGIGVVLWSRTVLNNGWVAVWFGFGMVLGVDPGSPMFHLNPWRFGYATAATVVTLAFLQTRRRRFPELTTVLILAGASALAGARSAFGYLLLTAVLVAWQSWPRLRSRSASATRIVVAIALLAFALFNIGQALILDGYLGAAAQERTTEQIDLSGSLILGGRPEIAATFALMRYQPMGFGSGTLATREDVHVAKTGLTGINYDPDNNYVEKFMFGSGYELHSVGGDLWSNFGLPGLAFGLFCMFTIIRGVANRLGRRSASAVLLYLSTLSIWNFLFGPLLTSMVPLTLAVGLAFLPSKTAKQAGHEHPATMQAIPSNSPAGPPYATAPRPSKPNPLSEVRR